MTHSLLLALVVTVLLPAFAAAAIQSRTLPVNYGTDPATGDPIVGECFLVWDDAARGPRPAVLVFPEWMGLNDYAKARARQLAELGYVAVAVDVYGNNKQAADAKEAAELSGLFKANRGLLRDRGRRVLETVRKLDEVDGGRVAAIGYCFGGTAVLELARSGAELRGVVSFHGDLSNPSPEDARNIRTRILVLHGAMDPLVPASQVQAFLSELNTVGADYTFVAYGRAVHSFTNPAAGSDPTRGVAYHPDADRRSWQALRAFLEEVMGG
jgi:dienelactone hydrolase